MPQLEGKFQPLTEPEKSRLKKALYGNAEDDLAILMGRDTSFAGSSDDDPTDDEVISQIRSVPCHYGR